MDRGCISAIVRKVKRFVIQWKLGFSRIKRLVFIYKDVQVSALLVANKHFQTKPVLITKILRFIYHESIKSLIENVRRKR